MVSPSVSAAPTKLGLLDMVPDRVLASGPAWLTQRRERALATLREAGFPARKTERWQFSPIHKVIAVPFEKAAATADAVAVSGSLPEGVRAVSMAEKLAGNSAVMEAHLGRLAQTEYFAALNLALFEDGLVLEIDAGADIEQPIEIVHTAASGSSPGLICPRVLIVAGANSRAQVVETFLGDGGEHLCVPVTEIVVGDNAALEHVRVALGQESGYHIASLAAHQARDSRYRSRVVTRGGPLSRVDVRAKLAGPGAECELFGFYHAAGRDHVDHPTLIDHAAPHCVSREIYRGIADGRGSAVFDGTIIVAPGAQKTSAHQENRNLILSDDASVNTKPHLEIDADDVTCSHGATIGALDPEALAYLRARGIGEHQARAMLTAAFVREILDHISGPALRHRLADALAPRLDLGDAAPGLYQTFDHEWDAKSR